MTEIAKDEIRRKLGNLTQIRELLFGEQIEDYDSRFQECQKRLETIEINLGSLESNLEKFKIDQQQQFVQLESSLSHDIETAINSLEKKLQYLSINTSTEVTKIHKSIETKTQRNSQIIDAVSKRFDTQSQNLREEITQTRISLEKDHNKLKQELVAIIEQDLTEFSKHNLSRHELADLLFDICLKIKGNNVNGELLDTIQSNGEMKAELMLPGDIDN